MNPSSSDRPAPPRPYAHLSPPTKRSDGRRFRVVLINNADCDLMFVVRTIMELTRLYRTEATHKMWQAHHLGRACVLVTHQERAELYVEQFAGKGIRVIIEPA